jgi:hypothetical protein
MNPPRYQDHVEPGRGVSEPGGDRGTVGWRCGLGTGSWKDTPDDNMRYERCVEEDGGPRSED